MTREKVYVVDEDDNVIAEKWRDETVPSDRIRVVSIWVENNMGEVLLAKRNSTKKIHPGLWGPSAAGGVTVGESYEEAAKKELSEEIGLDVDKHNIKLVEIDKYLYGTLDDGLRMMTVFSATINWPVEKFTYPAADVEALKWIVKLELEKELISNPEKYLPHANTWERFLKMS